MNSFHNCKVLIVDDNPVNVSLLSQTLGIEMKVREANSGKAAIKIAHDWLPDLILLDIGMPEINGFEVCEILKQDSDTMHIPVIFLTAFDSFEDIDKGFQLGAHDYIAKPFRIQEVRMRIKNQLELKLSTENLRRQNLELLKKTRTQKIKSPIIIYSLHKNSKNQIIRKIEMSRDIKGITTDVFAQPSKYKTIISPEDSNKIETFLQEVLFEGERNRVIKYEIKNNKGEAIAFEETAKEFQVELNGEKSIFGLIYCSC